MVKEKIYINGRFLSQIVTGVQRYAIEVLQGLDQLIESNLIDRDKYQLIVLIPKNSKATLPLQHISFQTVGKLKGQLWEQLELPFFTFGSVLINLCNTAPMLKRNQIVTIHDASTSANRDNYSKSFALWYNILHQVLSKRTKKIITNSKFSQSELLKYYPFHPEGMTITYLGADHIVNVEEDSSILERYNLAERSYILAVSSVNPNKNFQSVINILDQLTGNKKVVIVGNMDTPIYNKVNLESKENIVLVGYISDGELKTLYQNAECFIFPSFYEGFGLPPLEAMYCGCPVVSSNTVTMPEVLGDAALYFNPFNSQEIAFQVNKLTENEQLRSLYIEKGYKKSVSYTWRNCSWELFKVIEEIVKNENSHRA